VRGLRAAQSSRTRAELFRGQEEEETARCQSMSSQMWRVTRRDAAADASPDDLFLSVFPPCSLVSPALDALAQAHPPRSSLSNSRALGHPLMSCGLTDSA
jgi:hypothetical protein